MPFMFQDNIEKQFIYSHSRTVFDFLNEDASNAVSVDEFVNFGFLFNFREDAIKDIFKEFDLSGDQVCPWRMIFTCSYIITQTEGVCFEMMLGIPLLMVVSQQDLIERLMRILDMFLVTRLGCC